MVTSAGSTSGEELFLELRLGVLKGDYLPGQVFDRSEVCDLFGCTPRVAGTAFTTLVSEGYLFCPKPGQYGVRLWTAEQVDDLYDLRASFEGLAAARAAERAMPGEVALLHELVEELSDLSPDDPDAVDRLTKLNVAFHVEVMRMSKITELASLARVVVPNFLQRRIAWQYLADDAPAPFVLHKRIANAISAKSASDARAAMRDDVFVTRDRVMTEIADFARRAMPGTNAKLKRYARSAKGGRRIPTLGSREIGADGRIVPLGV